MPRQLRIEDLIAAARLLGVEELLRSVVSQESLDALKAAARATWKRLAFETHPDRNEGRDEEFKKAAAAWDLIEHLRWQPPPPRRVVVLRSVTGLHTYGTTVRFSGGFGTSSTVSSYWHI